MHETGMSLRCLIACAFVAGWALISSTACNDTAQTLVQRSLQASGDVSFLCRTNGVHGDGTGTALDQCPDYERAYDDPQRLELFGLVTQTTTGEVAVVNLSAGEKGEVVDVDKSTPGYTFLRVGGRPGDIVTTPGGVASFVGVSDVGRHAIVALPTSCIDAPKADERVRDITTWPTCHLPSAPGHLAIVLDTQNSCANPATPGTHADG